MSITFEQFLLSKHFGHANIYYCGGSLVIFKPAENEGADQYVLECDDNMVMIDHLHVLERRLYDDFGFEYSQIVGGQFNPEPENAGRGTHADMIFLHADYCDFYGINKRSAEELVIEPALQIWHRNWFQNYLTVWDSIPAVEIVAKPYKWVCGECGEGSIYWDIPAYWNVETQSLEMSNVASKNVLNTCSKCDTENQAKKVEIEL
jgi:hypothetical protein